MKKDFDKKTQEFIWNGVFKNFDEATLASIKKMAKAHLPSIVGFRELKAS
jgi:hypothetical protein